MALQKKYAEMQAMLEDVGVELGKFVEKGNKAAGTRARVGLSAISKACKELRDAIQKAKS